MCASSPRVTRFDFSGRRRTAARAAATASPTTPITTNAARQPQAPAMTGTIAGATIAPTLAPELNSAVANARSRFGNQCATALIDDGKFPPSPRPSADAREHEAAHAAHQRVAGGGQAPGGDRDRVADLHAEAIDELAEQQQAERVGAPETKELTSPYCALVQPSSTSSVDLSSAQDLPVDVVDRRRQEQQRADQPAITADAAVWSSMGGT